MGMMRVMGSRGDTEYRWDPADPNSVYLGKAKFDEMMDKKMLAFVPSDGGSRLIKVFEPNVREIVFTRQFVGG